MEVGGENRVKIGIVIKYEEKIHDFHETSVRGVLVGHVASDAGGFVYWLANSKLLRFGRLSTLATYIRLLRHQKRTLAKSY